jgi:hypothetical protein
MKKPSASDYDVRIHGSNLVVRFKPTESEFHFVHYEGRVSTVPDVRHAKTGDTGEYIAGEIGPLALSIAQEHAWEVWRAS